jgi:hypothetical protein
MMQTKPELKHLPVQQGCKAGVRTGAAAAAIVSVCVLVGLFFLSNRVDGYLEKRIVKEFNMQYPSYSLEIAGFHYNIWKNRIGFDSLMLASADSGFSCKLGKSWVSGVGWLQLIWKGMQKGKALSHAVADAQDMAVKFPHSDYGISCQRLHLSVPNGAVTAEAAEVKPLVDDEHYFAGSKYRLTRFRLRIPECSMNGLAVPELLAGRTCQARSIRLQALSLDALVDNYVPVDPETPPGRMPNEILNSIKQDIRIENFKIVNGKIKYGEIYARGAVPAIVTFDNLQVQSERIANHGKRGDTTVLHGQANFMQAGLMQLDIAIPLSSPEFSLKYSGSLNPMDINRLNPFLEHSEYLRIDSGAIARTTTFDIQVISGRASGVVKAEYKELKISILNKKTGSSRDIINRMASFLTHKFRLRNENLPDRLGVLNTGKVDYKRKPEETFIQFLWFSLRSGVLDVIFM